MLKNEPRELRILRHQCDSWSIWQYCGILPWLPSKSDSKLSNKKKSDLSQNIHRIDSSRGNWCPEGGFRWRLQVNYKWQWQTDISRKWNEIRWPINSHQWIVGNLLTTHFAAIQYLEPSKIEFNYCNDIIYGLQF